MTISARKLTPASALDRDGDRKSAPTLRLLAVDDEPSILELLKTALNALGSYDVTVAASGAEALEILDSASPGFDCILLDIQMPQMNGITLCRELRQKEGYAATPVIMLTAMSDRKYVDEAFAAGANDYVTKPFDFLELRSRVGMARKLVQQKARGSDGRGEGPTGPDASLPFALEDPVTLGKVERLLGHAEFENYVVQLSQGRLFKSFVTAIKIGNAKQLHGSLEAGAFRDLLQDVAEAIASATDDGGNMLSYRGNGVFLVISHGRGNVPTPDKETALSHHAAELRKRRNATGTPHLLIGDAVSMRSITKFGVLYSLNKAIEIVESREMSSRDVAGFSKRVLRIRPRSSEQSRLERRAYEMILHDMLKDDGPERT